MRKIEYIDPYEIKNEDGYEFDNPQNIDANIDNKDAVALWNTVMRKVRDKNGRVVLKAADTASQVLTRKIMKFMYDEDHIQEKFLGEPPTMKHIYTSAGLSHSTWGRIMSGELSDIERGHVFAIAVALRLNTEQTEELLYSAGFAINYELDLDAAIMYFIKREIYDIKRIKRVLSNFSCVKNGLDCFVFQPQSDNQRPCRGKCPNEYPCKSLK